MWFTATCFKVFIQHVILEGASNMNRNKYYNILLLLYNMLFVIQF
jgi:hypothetical protein